MLKHCKFIGANEWRNHFAKQFGAEGKDIIQKNIVCFIKKVKLRFIENIATIFVLGYSKEYFSHLNYICMNEN